MDRRDALPPVRVFRVVRGRISTLSVFGIQRRFLDAIYFSNAFRVSALT